MDEHIHLLLSIEQKQTDRLGTTFSQQLFKTFKLSPSPSKLALKTDNAVFCHCLTLSLHSVACSCLDLHHKTLKSLTQTVTSDWRRWNQLFVFSPMSISDRILCINPGLRQAMNSATLLHGQGHRRYNNNRHWGTMTEVRCFTKGQRSDPGRECNMSGPSCVCVWVFRLGHERRAIDLHWFDSWPLSLLFLQFFSIYSL